MTRSQARRASDERARAPAWGSSTTRGVACPRRRARRRARRVLAAKSWSGPPESTRLVVTAAQDRPRVGPTESTDAGPGQGADDARGDPAVDEQLGAVDVRGRVGQQEQHGAGDVVGGAEPTERHAARLAAGGCRRRRRSARTCRRRSARGPPRWHRMPFGPHSSAICRVSSATAGLGGAVGAGVGPGGDAVHRGHRHERARRCPRRSSGGPRRGP